MARSLYQVPYFELTCAQKQASLSYLNTLSAYNFRLNNFDLSKETQKECIYRLDWLLLEGAYIRNNILVSKYKGYNRGGGGVSYNGDCVGFNV